MNMSCKITFFSFLMLFTLVNGIVYSPFYSEFLIWILSFLFSLVIVGYVGWIKQKKLKAIGLSFLSFLFSIIFSRVIIFDNFLGGYSQIRDFWMETLKSDLAIGFLMINSQIVLLFVLVLLSCKLLIMKNR